MFFIWFCFSSSLHRADQSASPSQQIARHRTAAFFNFSLSLFAKHISVTMLVQYFRQVYKAPPFLSFVSVFDIWSSLHVVFVNTRPAANNLSDGRLETYTVVSDNFAYAIGRTSKWLELSTFELTTRLPACFDRTKPCYPHWKMMLWVDRNGSKATDVDDLLCFVPFMLTHRLESQVEIGLIGEASMNRRHPPYEAELRRNESVLYTAKSRDSFSIVSNLHKNAGAWQSFR